MPAYSRPELTMDDERCEKYKMRVKYAACPELREAKARDRAAQKAAKLQMVEWQKIKDEQCRGLAQGRSYDPRYAQVRFAEPPFISDLWKKVRIDGIDRWIYDHWMVEYTINELRSMLHRPIHHDGVNYTTYAFPAWSPVWIKDAVMGDHIDLNDRYQNPLQMCRRAPSVFSRRYWEQDSADAQLTRGLALGKKLWTAFACSGVRGMHLRFEPADHTSEFWRQIYNDKTPRKFRITQHRNWRCPHVFPAVVPQLLPVNAYPDEVNPELDDHADAPQPRGEAQFGDVNMSVLSAGGVRNFVEGLRPLLAEMAEKFESMKSTGKWLNVLLQGGFALAHMIQADWSFASVTTSMTQFLMSLPLVEGVTNALMGWAVSFLQGEDPTPAYRFAYPVIGGLAQSGETVDAAWMKVLTAVAAVFGTAVVTIGLGTMPGGTMTNNFINRISRMSAVVNSIADMQSWLTKLFDEVLDYIRVTWFGYSSSLLEEWKVFDTWCSDVAALRTTDFEMEARLDASVRIRVDSLLQRQEYWAKKFATMRIPPAQQARFVACSLFLERARQAVSLSGAGCHTPRVPPTIFHIVGGTGVGKSEMVNMLNAYLLAAHGYKDPTDLSTRIYFRDATQQRWDGYTNRVQGVVWDDFGMVKDTPSNPSNEPAEIVRAENSAPWQLEMANLCEKAQTYFQARWVLLTSNASSFKWENLTNPEAVNRRISRKFRQTVVPEYQRVVMINGAQTVMLDVPKVTKEALTDPTVYEKVWSFQEIDPQNVAQGGGDVEIGDPMDFTAFAETVNQTVQTRRASSENKLQHISSFFERCVAMRNPIVGQAHMEQEHPPTSTERLRRLREQLMEPEPPALSPYAADLESPGHDVSPLERTLSAAERGVPESTIPLYEATEAKEVLSKGRTATVFASSRAEMMSKMEPVCDYLYGGHSGNNPTGRGNPAHFERLEPVPRVIEREDDLAHLTWPSVPYKQTWAEWATGMVHLNLRRVVLYNEFPEEKKVLYRPPPDYDATPLLSKTCAVVPGARAREFTKAFCLANAVYVLQGFGVNGALIKAQRARDYGQPFDASALELFNAVMYTHYGRLDDTELCGQHGDERLTWKSSYQCVEASTNYLLEWFDWMKMTVSTMKQEVMFTTIRVLIILGVSSAAAYLMKMFFSWKNKKTPAKPKPTPNAESAPEKTPGARRGPVESRQENTAGPRRGPVESHQDKTAGSRRGKVESSQEKTAGPSRGPVETAPFVDEEGTAASCACAPSLFCELCMRRGYRTCRYHCVHGDAQSSFDQNAKELEQKLAKNTYSITRVVDGVSTRLAQIVFIAGRVAITNRHVVKALRGEVQITNSDYSRTMNIPVAELRFGFLDEKSIHGYKDVALIEFPRAVMLHPDIRKHFMTKEDFCNHKELQMVALYSLSAQGHLQIRYSGMCRAEDRVAFSLECPTQETVLVREWYMTDIQTQRGDCGGILSSHDSAFERKFIGIHMAGMDLKPYSAAAVAVHQGVLKELVDALPLRYPESLDCAFHEVPNPHGITQFDRPFEGDYTLLGTGPEVHANVVSQIVLSPIAEAIEQTCGPALTKPAMLRPNKEHDPLAKARQKAFAPGVVIDDALLEECATNYRALLERDILETDRRVLSFEEAIAGVEGDPFYTGIKRNTSPGYGWNAGGKGKRAFLGDEEYIFDHPEVVQKTAEMMDRLLRGERSQTVWTDTLKDERRPIDKVDAGKTRLFAAGELAYLILFRQYFSGFAAHMARNRIELEACIGINPYSQDWNRLGQRLTRHGKNVVAGDFSNFDGTLSAAVLWKCLDLIQDFYQGTEEEAFIRRRLWIDIVHSVHTTKGVMYMWNHSQPSGCPITATLNSLYHSLVARYVYVLCARKYQPDATSLTNFNNKVAHANYGDDDVYNIDESIIDWYNQITMAEMFQTIGMTYTDELKTGELVKARSLDEIQFLKRKFRWDDNQSRYRAPLSLDTILEMARWVKGKKNHWTLAQETLQEALYEAAEHERSVFEDVVRKLEPARRLVNKRLPCPASTYDAYQESQLWKYCV